ncbi:hypothetical protein R4646_17750 [Acinetobacter baumannii]|uniref:hypothetical protein n=1 Tax=Acinetobacter baumannii TaxID=470 RepID=UPI00244D2C79|nr:hypothetical protein [Acinetobacter baumannii]MDH2648682.1 hypothetical protein [Acinetobacter baumannii]MDV7648784.1 hypothetical protein [Acinetobacter baumannii]MDV7648793.1 hypothetical protein [Acinetobacter baumannii]MDV7648802.1 hypothetical protein [Acinetobacter baumannii]
MYSWLRSYLCVIFLMIISSSSFAVDPKVTQMGGFPYTVVCSHATNLDFCADARVANAKETACRLWMTQLNSTYSYSFDSVVSGSPDYCMYSGRNPSNGAKVTTTQQLTTKSGLCPPQGDPPPTTVIFSRQGRWFPQELEDKRCFRNCLYSGGQNFSYKHYSFTNGIMTEFTSISGGLKSQEQFCDAKPEPVRNSEGEITYDAGCEDNMFKVFCDFVEWFRSDSEMPTAPEVENKSLAIDQHLKTDWVLLDDNRQVCFEPVQFDLYLPFSGDEFKYEMSFDNLCNKFYEFGNIWRALYLFTACFIVFGGRN